jgi:hypothetical protein
MALTCADCNLPIMRSKASISLSVTRGLRQDASGVALATAQAMSPHG